jgi:hypothetical protein
MDVKTDELNPNSAEAWYNKGSVLATKLEQ